MASDHYKYEVTMDHANAKVAKVHLAAGHEIPQHSHEHDYIVHPQAATKLVKTSYKDGKVLKTEEVTHEANKPYFVAKSEDGVTFSLKNVGSGPMMCEKTMIKSK